jgi:large subunit ribosomal protein L18
VDDAKGHTLASASTLEEGVIEKTGASIQAAKKVGSVLGERAKALKIEKVVFDRGAWPYHGRIQALADGARSAGLKF